MLTDAQKEEIYRDTKNRTKPEIEWLAKMHDLAQKVAGDVFYEMCIAAKRISEEKKSEQKS